MDALVGSDAWSFVPVATSAKLQRTRDDAQNQQRNRNTRNNTKTLETLSVTSKFGRADFHAGSKICPEHLTK
jgi:hypothetical protein